jgi:outer membrane murein-binding lipoprotein Lpp
MSSVNPGSLSPGSDPTLVDIISAAFSANPVGLGASVVAGIYGAYTSTEMADALSRIADLTNQILSAVQALNLEVDQLAQDTELGSAQGAVESLRGFEIANSALQQSMITAALTSVNGAVDSLYNSASHNLSFVQNFFTAVTLQSEVTKREIQFDPGVSDVLRSRLITGIIRGCDLLMQMEDWPAPQKLVQPKWESPGRVSPGGTHEKAKERRRGRAIVTRSRPRSGQRTDDL